MRIFYLVSIACICLLISINLIEIYNLPKYKNPTDPTVIPYFRLETLNGMTFNNCDLPEDSKPLIFMIINPKCPDCKSILKSILKYCEEFEQVNLIIVAEGQLSDALELINEYGIQAHDYIQVLFDRTEQMTRNYNLIEVPSFVIYNDQLALITVLEGNFAFPVLIKYVRQALKK